MNCDNREVEYVVIDPSKNITILVTSDVDENDYALVAKKLLEMEPNAEQVGFLKLKEKNNSVSLKSVEECDIILNMAGNEFCGNATMSAAVYNGIENGLRDSEVVVKASGVDEPVRVHVKKLSSDDEWEGIVEMPRALTIKEIDFGNGEKFSVVFFKGIAHIIIDNNSGARKAYPYDVPEAKIYLEKKIKEWCDFLKVPALGVMVISGFAMHSPYAEADDICHYDGEVVMTPLVYVKSIDTLYWESSCASGTTAVGVYVADRIKKEVEIDVKQPSETVLSIEKTIDGKLLLAGKVNLLYKKSVII